MVFAAFLTFIAGLIHMNPQSVPPSIWQRPVPFFVSYNPQDVAHQGNGFCVTTDFHTYNAMLDLGDSLYLAGAIGLTCEDVRGLWPNDPRF